MKYGFCGTVLKFRRAFQKVRERRAYARWATRNELNAVDRQRIVDEIAGWEKHPTISVIVPVYNVDERWLVKCIDSVKTQLYPYWELCIADDKSPSQLVEKVLREAAADEPRLKLVFRATNGHISAASNSALELAGGEMCVLLDHDDELSVDALYHVAKELNEHPDVCMIYSDEDMIDEKGRRSNPKFKPDFSWDLMYSLNLVTHLSAYRTSMLRSIGGFRVGLEGSQDYDLALRVIEQIPESSVRHIPHILYHWRAIRGSVALDAGAKPYAYEKARDALRDHFGRMGKAVDVEAAYLNLNRVRYHLPEQIPTVTLITHSTTIPNIKLREITSYSEVEHVHTRTTSDLNELVKRSSSSIICFIRGDCDPCSGDWLSELVRYAIQPEIGVVGGKIIDRCGMVIDGPLVYGLENMRSPAHLGLMDDDDGNMVRNRLTSNFSGVSLGLMAIRRDLFNDVGGFENVVDPEFVDLDLCLKVRRQGKRVVSTPSAVMTASGGGMESGSNDDRSFRRRWEGQLGSDPFYNRNLSRKQPFRIPERLDSAS